MCYTAFALTSPPVNYAGTTTMEFNTRRITMARLRIATQAEHCLSFRCNIRDLERAGHEYSEMANFGDS